MQRNVQFRLIISVVTLIITQCYVFAQDVPVKKDTTKIYAKIESYSKRSKVGTFMYQLVFKPVAIISKKPVKQKVYSKLIQQPYNTFEGKIIRNINIITGDPFGYSLTDPTLAKQNFLFRTGNTLHVKTQVITIQNLLLFRKNREFNSFLVKESERLIRKQKYLHEVAFSVVSANKESDSVDITINIRDKWTIIPEGSLSTSSFKASLTDKNFLGTGHEFKSVFKRDMNQNIGSFNTDYSIPNIRNSYVRSDFHYGFDGYGNYRRGISVDRPFFSSYAKWAAGISFVSQYRKDSLKYINLVSFPQNLKFITTDIWGGYAMQLFRGSSEDELATNLIFTARYLSVRYSETLSYLYDPLRNYSNEDFYLTGIGISTRKYVRDKYIYNYGTVEDVPVGRVYSLTGGYQVKNDIGRYYLGVRYSAGNYHEWGYLSSTFEYGTFFRASAATQGTIKTGVNYFTGLIETGKWKFRQFINPQLTLGINRFSYDSLTLNESYGLNGFNSTALSGTGRFVVTLQTQSYSPWNIIGFRFGPFLSYSLGLLGDAGRGFRGSKIYSQVGLGVLIKNENMVFNTFQFSVSFFPLIPGIGQNVFKMNSFRTSDLGFRDFEAGKPDLIRYR